MNLIARLRRCFFNEKGKGCCEVDRMQLADPMSKDRSEKPKRCKQCGAPLEQKSTRGRPRKFCNTECSREFWLKKRREDYKRKKEL